MPWCDTDAMAAHLIEISAAVDPVRWIVISRSLDEARQ